MSSIRINSTTDSFVSWAVGVPLYINEGSNVTFEAVIGLVR